MTSASRRIYLDTLPWEEGLDRWFAALEQAGVLAPAGSEPVGSEMIPVGEALGRITAAPVYARRSSPHFVASAMDGVATRAALTFDASETAPRRLRLGVDALEVDTGDPLPSGFDCVIMAEDVHYADRAAGVVEVIQPASPWQHVRQIGEDIVATEMLFPAGRSLRPEDLGALLACGHSEVPVRRRPSVAVVPTGTEVVPAGVEPAPGQIPDYNSTVVSALVSQWGGEARVLPVCPDDPAMLAGALAGAACSADVVALIAGSSAGREDFTSAAVSGAGAVVVHGVAIKPGKPVVLGYSHGKPVVGLPGYPVSAYITACMFLRPLLYRLQGLPAPQVTGVKAVLSRRAASQAGVDEYVRVKLGSIDGRLVATPVARGAGLITSLVRADGIMRIPRFSEGFEEGSEAPVQLLRPVDEIVNSVVIIGSHDVALDVLGGMLSAHHPGYSVSSAHVGSMGGLTSLRRGEAHACGTHLLDPGTGDYNTAYVRRMLPGTRVHLVTLAHRQQGFMVRKGNPRCIRGFEDLARGDVMFVNRQRGAGTRLLLDYHLNLAGIDPVAVHGYEWEEFTHMAVAAAVSSGTADVGLGILAAARALDLEFIPVGEERYELAIPAKHLEAAPVRLMLEVLRTEEFKKAVESLGGYDTRETGIVRVVGGEPVEG
ncbi:MAG: molybdopterin biosynthesis protein [Firmicutes bacterium]|nr:molybdopterin biosynthesis protein [Bacillota bacterium]